MQLCLLPPPICEHQFQFHFQNGPFTRRALFFSSLIWDPRRAIRCTVCTCHRVEARRGRVRQGKAGRGSAGRKREGARAAAVDAAPCEHRQPRQPSQPASQPTDTDSEKHTHTQTRNRNRNRNPQLPQRNAQPTSPLLTRFSSPLAATIHPRKFTATSGTPPSNSFPSSTSLFLLFLPSSPAFLFSSVQKWSSFPHYSRLASTSPSPPATFQPKQHNKDLPYHFCSPSPSSY